MFVFISFEFTLDFSFAKCWVVLRCLEKIKLSFVQEVRLVAAPERRLNHQRCVSATTRQATTARHHIQQGVHEIIGKNLHEIIGKNLQNSHRGDKVAVKLRHSILRTSHCQRHQHHRLHQGIADLRLQIMRNQLAYLIGNCGQRRSRWTFCKE